MKTIHLLAALALGIGGVAAAGTRAVAEVPSIVVEYGDLNLDSTAGVKKLHARLRGAAELVCQSLDSRVIRLRGQFGRCVNEAVTQSVADIGNAKLSNYHRTGRVVTTIAMR